MRLRIRILVMIAWACVGPAHAADSPDSVRTLKVGGFERRYLLHLPVGAPTGPLPLVVVLHGGGGNGAEMASMSGFDAEADLHGFVVAYPDGTGKRRPWLETRGAGDLLTWNAGHCCGYAKAHHVDDVAFIRAVVADVERQHAVDPKRVYATGISNGAMMSYLLACEASDVFSAIGPVAGIMEADRCKPTHKVSIIDFQGTADDNIPINGGVGRKALVRQKLPPVQHSIDFWRKLDGCSVTVNADAADLHMVDYGGCADGTAVDYYIVQGGGHDWPGGRRMAFFLDKPDPNVPATNIIWSFFAEHSKP